MTNSPASPTLRPTTSLDICGAPRYRPCVNPINPDERLPGRLVHEGRLIDRNRSKEDE